MPEQTARPVTRLRVSEQQLAQDLADSDGREGPLHDYAHDLHDARSSYNLEVEQFNEGFEVARAWIGDWPLDPRSQEPAWRDQDKPDMDTFGSGFTWGAYERVVADLRRAVNHHEALVAALKAAESAMGQLPPGNPAIDISLQMARAVLARVEGPEADSQPERAKR